MCKTHLVVRGYKSQMKWIEKTKQIMYTTVFAADSDLILELAHTKSIA